MAHEKNYKPFKSPEIKPKPGQPATKTSGIKIRGTGAATKGLMARGKMA